MNGTIKETIIDLINKHKTFIDYKEAFKILSQYDKDISFITDLDKKKLMQSVSKSKELSIKVVKL